LKSGDFCSDKKRAVVNWIEERRNSVVCEAGTSEEVLKKVQESVQSLVELNKVNLPGLAIVGAWVSVLM
jgi:hydroxymethylglutaryl-CoA reductase